MITTFLPVKISQIRSGTCSACHKRMKRTYTFEQTINPYNRKADGKTPKTREDIIAELQAERTAAGLVPIIHASCEREAALAASKVKK